MLRIGRPLLCEDYALCDRLRAGELVDVWPSLHRAGRTALCGQLQLWRTPTREQDGIWPHGGAVFELGDGRRDAVTVSEGGCREDLPYGEPLKSTSLVLWSTMRSGTHQALLTGAAGLPRDV